ncbi:MAG: hypothetical protein NUV47_01260 [Patescibacteria group bacterium]|nr:hypothetical protein [Patescibacteria group bacterium]
MITSIITILIATGVAIRNHWVFSAQMKLIGNPRRLEYLSYDTMMLKFWIWDVEKLKRKNEK